MNTLTTRIARLAAASALALSLGALRAGPAWATYNSWAARHPRTALWPPTTTPAPTPSAGAAGSSSAEGDASPGEQVPNDERAGWGW